MNHKLPPLYYIAKFVLTPIFKWYYKPTIINKENIPQSGPVILAGNHIHLYDQCLSIISTKRGIHYLAKNEYFTSKKTAWFFKSTGCIPVNRKAKDENAKNLALNVLKDNGVIGIFPEGTRNKTTKDLLPFKFGAVSLAKKTDAWIVPFGITGSYKFHSNNLTIKFGTPFKVGIMDLKTANDKLFKEVLRLKK